MGGLTVYAYKKDLYDLTVWLPEDQKVGKRKESVDNSYITVKDFTVMSPLKLAILSHSTGEQSIIKEANLNLIDGINH